MTRWRSGLAAAGASVLTVVLIVLDVVDDDLRAWWVDHALTTATVTGLLVLLVTVLVVDQVTDLRRARDHSRAVGVQGIMVLEQGLRSIRSAGAALDGGGVDTTDAEHEIRTYLLMLLVSGPVLIESTAARAFLEEAQHLGVQMTALLDASREGRSVHVSRDRVDEAERRLRSAAEPLLTVLSPAERRAVAGTGA